MTAPTLALPVTAAPRASAPAHGRHASQEHGTAFDATLESVTGEAERSDVPEPTGAAGHTDTDHHRTRRADHARPADRDEAVDATDAGDPAISAPAGDDAHPASAATVTTPHEIRVAAPESTDDTEGTHHTATVVIGAAATAAGDATPGRPDPSSTLPPATNPATVLVPVPSSDTPAATSPADTDVAVATGSAAVTVVAVSRDAGTSRRTPDSGRDDAPAVATRPTWAATPAAPASPTTPATPASRSGDSGPTPGTPATPATTTTVASPALMPQPAAHEGMPAVADSDATDAARSAATDPVPVAAPVGAPLTARTAAPSAAAATAPALPAALAETVATHLRGLHRSADGAHHAVLLVDAAGLGQVRIELRTQGTTVDLVLRGGHAAATDALRDAMPDLRRALADSGLVAGSTDVADARPDLASTWGGGTADGTRRDHPDVSRRGSADRPSVTSAPTGPPRERTRTTVVDLIA